MATTTAGSEGVPEDDWGSQPSILGMSNNWFLFTVILLGWIGLSVVYGRFKLGAEGAMVAGVVFVISAAVLQMFTRLFTSVHWWRFLYRNVLKIITIIIVAVIIGFGWSSLRTTIDANTYYADETDRLRIAFKSENNIPPEQGISDNLQNAFAEYKDAKVVDWDAYSEENKWKGRTRAVAWVFDIPVFLLGDFLRNIMEWLSQALTEVRALIGKQVKSMYVGK